MNEKQSLFAVVLMILIVVLSLLGCVTATTTEPKPGCDPAVWNEILQLAAFELGYQKMFRPEFELCIHCPELGQQLGVDCFFLHLGDVPQLAKCSISGGSVYEVDCPDSESLRRYQCITGCKLEYKYCMQYCVAWTWPTIIWPTTYELAETCDDKCKKEEERCLDKCFGKNNLIRYGLD